MHVEDIPIIQPALVIQAVLVIQAALVDESLPSVLQILHLVEFIDEFLNNNPFVVCSEELNHVKHELAREGDSVKVKHKTGIILYKATQDRSVGFLVC